MSDHTGRVLEAVAGRLRQLDRRLHIDHNGRSEWDWAIPIAGFVVTVAILIVAGVMSGVWAAEYIPTALVVGLVMAGLFVACMAPEAGPPEDDHGNRGPDKEPSSTPPQLDPRIWVALLADLDVDTIRAGEERGGDPVGEPAGASL
jgi:peptidoglycan/LPS O-acetylase OafA/YrhL